MRRPSFGVLLFLFGVLLTCAPPVASREDKDEPLPPEKLDDKGFRSLLVSKAADFEANGDTNQVTLLKKALKVPNLKDSTFAFFDYTYDKKPQIKFDAAKLPDPVAPAELPKLEAAFKALIQHALEKTESWQVGTDKYLKPMTAKNIKEVVAALTLAQPVVAGDLKGVLKELKDLKAAMDGLTQKVDALDPRLKNLETVLKDMPPVLQGLVKKLDGIDPQLKGFETKLDGMEGPVKDISKQLGDLTKKMEELGRRLPQSNSGSSGGTRMIPALPAQSLPDGCGGCGTAPLPGRLRPTPLQEASRVSEGKPQRLAKSTRREPTAPVARTLGMPEVEPASPPPAVPVQTAIASVADRQPQRLKLADREAIVDLNLTGLSENDAADLFWRGYGLYWQGDYSRALTQFRAAVKLADNDARFWYFKSLTEEKLDDVKAAESSLRRAAELHQKGLPSAEAIGLVLERVQGPQRTRLNAALEANRARR